VIEGAGAQRHPLREGVADVILEEREDEAVLAPVDDVVRPAGEQMHLDDGDGVRLADGLHGALARPRGDDVVPGAVDEQERKARDRGRVERRLPVEEGQPAAHQARHRGEAVRRARSVENGAGPAVAEAGEGHAVGVHVEVGEELREERLDRGRRLLLPPEAVRLGEGDQGRAPLDRGAGGLRGGDGAAGAAAEDNDQREGLVAPVVVGDVQTGAAAEASVA
jgi:hypothetical protein